jgi:hypothetical protein
MLDPVKLSGYIDWLDNKINNCTKYDQMQQLMTLRAQAAQLVASQSSGGGSSLTQTQLAITLNETINPTVLLRDLGFVRAFTNNLDAGVAAGNITRNNISTKLDQVIGRLNPLESLTSNGLMVASEGALEDASPRVIFDRNPNRKYLMVQNQDLEFPMGVGFTDIPDAFISTRIILAPGSSIFFEAGRFCPTDTVAVATIENPVAHYVAYEGA